MAKKKLIRRGLPMQRKSKSIRVEDVNGNKHILRATVIGIETDKIRKERSSSIPDDRIQEIGFNSGIIKPPLSQTELSVLSEFSSELGPNIDGMVMGVEGFGVKIQELELSPAHKKKYESQINAERRWIQVHIIDNPNPEGGIRKLRKILERDKESTGNSYLELVPSLKEGKYSCYNRIEAGNVWIVKADKTFTRISQKYVNENFQTKEKKFLRKLRKFVQIVGNNKVFYKEFRDKRPMDARNGEILRMRSNDQGEKVPVNKKGDPVPKKFLANELFHFKIPTTRKTPYGMPRFTGNIIAVKGSRSSEETNIITQQNNNVPSMVILVSGGMLTDGSIKRIQEFVDTAIKGDLNYSKFLILEGEGQHDSLSGQSSMKIEIKPMTNDQHTDALWDTYDEKNSNKIRRAWRQPKHMVGNGEKIDRQTARESERFAEKYIYNPEREELDEDWNRILAQQGIRFHRIKTNSANVTNDEDIVKLLGFGEKTGGVTPRIAREMLEDVMNRKFPPIVEDDPDFNPDLPFSISVGKLARGAARSNQNGTMASRGQEEADRGVDNNDKNVLSLFQDILNPDENVERLMLSQMEEVLDMDVFGESKKDYFKQREHNDQ